jgi:hypothetical protein
MKPDLVDKKAKAVRNAAIKLYRDVWNGHNSMVSDRKVSLEYALRDTNGMSIQDLKKKGPGLRKAWQIRQKRDRAAAAALLEVASMGTNDDSIF